MIFEMVDGRNLLYQWDLNRKITVNDESIKEVHFCNRTDSCSLVVEVVDGLANIPNILLQSNFDIRVYGYDGEATLHEEVFKVKARTRPADYVYTETQVLTVEQLAEELRTEIDERITAVEEGLITDGFATTEYVDESINALNIPEANQVYIDVNFNNQAAMKAEIEDALALNQIPVLRLNNIPYLYAGTWGNICVFTRTNINPNNNKDVTIFQIKYNLGTQKLEGSTPSGVPVQFKLYPNNNSEATENLTKIIIDGVNYAIPQGGDTDLSNYYTKSEVDGLIPDTSSFITEVPAEYITETELNNKGYLTEHQSLEGYATEEYVNEAVSNVSVDLSGYAKESYVDSAIAQSVSGLAEKEHTHEDYAKKTDIPSLEGYATEAYVDEALANIDIPSGGFEYVSELNTKADIDAILAAGKLPVYRYNSTTEKHIAPLTNTTSEYYEFSALEGTYSFAVRLNLETGLWSGGRNTRENLDDNADLSNYYTKEEVDELISEGGGSADLSNYYTKDETYSKTEVDEAIAEAGGSGGSGGASYTFTNGLTETDGTVSWDLNDAIKNIGSSNRKLIAIGEDLANARIVNAVNCYGTIALGNLGYSYMDVSGEGNIIAGHFGSSGRAVIKSGAGGNLLGGYLMGTQSTVYGNGNLIWGTSGYNSSTSSGQSLFNGEASIVVGKGLIGPYDTQITGLAMFGKCNDKTALTDKLLVLGNGANNGTRSNAFTVDNLGNVVAAGTVSPTGADYAEYFEFEDSNPNKEDRMGLLVELVGNKIRLANGTDILGATSTSKGVIGDAEEMNWHGKYETDELGRVLFEEVEVTEEVTNEDGTIEQITKLVTTKKISKDYDPNVTYIPRRDRLEWAPVGLLGKVLVRQDGSLNAGDYVKAINGIATKSEEKTNIRVLEIASEGIVRVLIK